MLQGLTFKGYSGTVLHSGRPDFQEEFNKYFTVILGEVNPAESLRQAQITLFKKHPENLDWARYRYYGFPGMSDMEKEAFAIKH